MVRALRQVLYNGMPGTNIPSASFLAKLPLKIGIHLFAKGYSTSKTLIFAKKQYWTKKLGF
jgi:hypothetical protein